MIIERRHLVSTLLCTAVLCGCAGQQHRSESAPGDSSARADEADDAQDETLASDDDDRDNDLDENLDERRAPAARDRPVATHGGLNVDEPVAPDNSAINERDRGGATLTPGDQGNTERDLEITRRIRETVVEDDALSFTAKNVKIITLDGRVTLRGPVRSEAERASIEKKALAVAGAGRVENLLEIE